MYDFLHYFFDYKISNISLYLQYDLLKETKGFLFFQTRIVVVGTN